MAKPAREIPAKLKNDAIVEALVELRFDMPEGSVPEIFFVRLAESPAWKEFHQRMLPLFHLPVQVRMSDVNLRYQPALELVHRTSNAPSASGRRSSHITGSRLMLVGRSFDPRLTKPWCGYSLRSLRLPFGVSACAT